MKKSEVRNVVTEMNDLNDLIDRVVWCVMSIADARSKHKPDCRHAAVVKNLIDTRKEMYIKNKDDFAKSISEISSELINGDYDSATAANHIAACNLKKEKDDMKASQYVLSGLLLAASDISNAIKSEYLGLPTEENKENQ
jgi:hypothetical protein